MSRPLYQQNNNENAGQSIKPVHGLKYKRNNFYKAAL